MLNSSEWPKQRNNLDNDGEDVPEERTVSFIIHEAKYDLFIFDRYFSLMKLIRIIFYCWRFTNNALKRRKMTGPISACKVEETMTLIIKVHFTLKQVYVTMRL